MSLVRIVEADNYSIDYLKEKIKEVLDWVDFKQLEGKSVSIFFDNVPPNINILISVKEILEENGVKKVNFGSSNIIEENFRKIESQLKEFGLDLHDFREEPFVEVGVEKKAKKSEHYPGYAILSPGQYQVEKAFEQSEYMKFRTLKKVYLPYILEDSDYIIPVLKLKDSPISKIGGFINALLYIIPTNLRSEIFLKLLNQKFNDALLDIFGAVKNNVIFGLVDGIEADLATNEDNNYNILLASSDLLSLDSVMSVIVGFRSSDIETNKLGSLYDLGKGLLKEVVIDGVDFTKIRKDLVNKLKFSKAFNRRFIPTIEKQEDKIDKVMEFCPTGAILTKEKNYFIDKSKCIKCNFCLEIAPDIFKV